MGASQHGQLPPDLVRGQCRFRAWREQRKPGCRIPQSLWAMAIRLAKAHGVSRTAAVLRLDYYRLKERAEAATTPPQPNGPAFVELTPPVLVARQCRFEFDNGDRSLPLSPASTERHRESCSACRPTSQAVSGGNHSSRIH